MSPSENISLFLPSGCLSYEASQAYINQELEESYALKVEAHLAECELCREAVEGLKMARNFVEMNSMLDSLNKEVMKRAAERKQDQTIPKGVSRGTRWAWVSAAASVIIIGLFSFYFYNLNKLPFNDVAEGYIPVSMDREDVFQLPQPQIEMQSWYASDAGTESQIEIIEEEDAVYDEEYDFDEVIPSRENDIAVVEDEVSTDEDLKNYDQAAKTPATAYSTSPETTAKIEEQPIVTSEKRSTTDVTATKSMSSGVTLKEANTVSATIQSADNAFVNEELRLETTQPEPIYTVVEKMPSFPGGKEALLEYLSGNYSLPEELIGSGIDSTIYLEFVVDPNGNARMIKVISGISPKADRQAVKLIRKMPRWEAGVQRGRNVAVRMNVAVPVKDPSMDQ